MSVKPGLQQIAFEAGFAIRTPDDPEHVVRIVFRKMQVVLVPPENLFRSLRSAEVCHHLRVAQEFLKQLQVRV